MPRPTRDLVVGLLLEAGANEEAAEQIVKALERAGLKPARMRAWLAHPRRAYGVRTAPVVIAGMETWPRSVPTHAIEDGWTDVVVTAAEEFAAAPEEERFLSLTFLCGLDRVRRLTHQDAERTDQVCEVARLLLRSLGKDVIVNEALQTRLLPSTAPDGSLADDPDTRLVDCLMDDRLGLVLAALRDGSLDPRTLDRERALGFWVGDIAISSGYV